MLSYILAMPTDLTHGDIHGHSVSSSGTSKLEKQEALGFHLHAWVCLDGLGSALVAAVDSGLVMAPLGPKQVLGGKSTFSSKQSLMVYILYYTYIQGVLLYCCFFGADRKTS